MTATLTPPAALTPAAPAPDAPRLVGITEVARRLGVSLPTIERQKAAGKMPLPRRIGATIRWDLAELDAWMDRPKADGSLMTEKEWRPIWQQLVKGRRN